MSDVIFIRFCCHQPIRIGFFVHQKIRIKRTPNSCDRDYCWTVAYGSFCACLRSDMRANSLLSSNSIWVCLQRCASINQTIEIKSNAADNDEECLRVKTNRATIRAFVFFFDLRFTKIHCGWIQKKKCQKLLCFSVDIRRCLGQRKLIFGKFDCQVYSIDENRCWTTGRLAKTKRWEAWKFHDRKSRSMLKCCISHRKSDNAFWHRWMFNSSKRIDLACPTAKLLIVIARQMQ